MTRKLRVAIVMGGRSSEHEISLASARSVIGGLDPERYETVTVEIGRDGTWALGAGVEQAELVAAAERRALPREIQERSAGGARDETLPVPLMAAAALMAVVSPTARVTVTAGPPSTAKVSVLPC